MIYLSVLLIFPMLNVIDFYCYKLSLQWKEKCWHKWVYVYVCVWILNTFPLYQYITKCGRLWWKENKTSRRMSTLSLQHLSSSVNKLLMKVCSNIPGKCHVHFSGHRAVCELQNTCFNWQQRKGVMLVSLIVEYKFVIYELI